MAGRAQRAANIIHAQVILADYINRDGQVSMLLMARGAFNHRSIACAEQAKFVAIRLSVTVPVKERDIGAMAIRPIETISAVRRILDSNRVM